MRVYRSAVDRLAVCGPFTFCRMTPRDVLVVSGKSGAGKESPEQKKDDTELWSQVEAQAAFLGPNLWDKTLPYDADLKVTTFF